MSKESPILVRLFKEEAELEVWKQDRDGHFALLKTYPICRWSGELGPKIKEGDRQAPEGFYTITPGLMNPNSNYYLAINMGFPNAYDKANGRTGNFLMIHGDCSSRGCYAMTDEQIAEIYALARESLLRRPARLPDPGLSVPDDAAQHGQASQLAAHGVLAHAQAGLRPFRSHAPRAEGRRLRAALRLRRRDATAKFSPAGKVPGLPRCRRRSSPRSRTSSSATIAQVAEYVRQGTPTVAVAHPHRRRHAPDLLGRLPKPHTDASGVIRSPGVSLPGTIPAHASPPQAPEPVDRERCLFAAVHDARCNGAVGRVPQASGSAACSRRAVRRQSSGGARSHVAARGIEGIGPGAGAGAGTEAEGPREVHADRRQDQGDCQEHRQRGCDPPGDLQGAAAGGQAGS